MELTLTYIVIHFNTFGLRLRYTYSSNNPAIISRGSGYGLCLSLSTQAHQILAHRSFGWAKATSCLLPSLAEADTSNELSQIGGLRLREHRSQRAMAKEDGGAAERTLDAPPPETESIVWSEDKGRFETPDGEAFLQYRLLDGNGAAGLLRRR